MVALVMALVPKTSKAENHTRQQVRGSNRCAIALKRPRVLSAEKQLSKALPVKRLHGFFYKTHAPKLHKAKFDRWWGNWLHFFPSPTCTKCFRKGQNLEPFSKQSTHLLHANWSRTEISFMANRPLYKTSCWHCLARCWLAGNRRLALIDRKQWEEVPQVMQLALCKVQFQDPIQQIQWCLTWREPNEFIDPLLKSFAQVWWYSQGPRERMHVHKVIPVACNSCT